MMLCAGPVVRRCEPRPLPRFAYARASSSKAPVPEALSLAPGPTPVSSRCAITTIASGARPGATATMLRSSTRPRPGISALKTSVCGANPCSCRCSDTQRAALCAPTLPGRRSGIDPASSSARSSAAMLSNVAGRLGGGSVGAFLTLNAAIRSGIATSSHVPRYERPLIGRSSEPRRGRRRSARGGTDAMRGYSRREAPFSPRAGSSMPDSATILLVDDEDAVQKLLAYPLQRDGYRVVSAVDGQEALERFAQERVDLVVLDLMLPKVDGLEVCRRLRATSQVPIIMLTARDDELDKVVGLELGADDYITKPFSIREFRSRVRALLRRAAVAPTTDGNERLTLDELSIDVGRRSVELAGEPVQLTYVEFEILRTLAARPGHVFTRRVLLEQLWGDASYRDPRTIDVHIRHLREKLEPKPREPKYILTVRGVGYRFRER